MQGNEVPGPLKIAGKRSQAAHRLIFFGGTLVETHTTAVTLQYYSVVVTHLNEHRITDN